MSMNEINEPTVNISREDQIRIALAWDDLTCELDGPSKLAVKATYDSLPNQMKHRMRRVEVPGGPGGSGNRQEPRIGPFRVAPKEPMPPSPLTGNG
jgi:hypothetical protein